LKLTVKENFCRTALNVMLRAEAKAQVELNNISLNFHSQFLISKAAPNSSPAGNLQVHRARQQRG
jgi:hypothetical protein